MGLTLGPVGNILGSPLGLQEGSILGFDVKEGLALMLGITLGSTDGLIEFTNEGNTLGQILGLTEGILDGDTVGSQLGKDDDGSSDGYPLGTLVDGFPLGLILDGTADGILDSVKDG